MRLTGRDVGHDEKRTANSYQSFDPDYLADCAEATDSIIGQLQAFATRPLPVRKVRATAPLRVAGATPFSVYLLNVLGEWWA